MPQSSLCAHVKHKMFVRMGSRRAMALHVPYLPAHLTSTILQASLLRCITVHGYCASVAHSLRVQCVHVGPLLVL